MSRHRLTSYIEVLPQMANKSNYLAICLACIEFNDRVYAIEHKFTNTKNQFKICKNILKTSGCAFSISSNKITL